MEELKNIEIVSWDYGIIEKDTDFILTEWDVDWLPTLFEQDDVYFEYNQSANSWSKASCTLFNAFGAVSDLENYKFSLAQIKEINDLSYTKWRVQWDGWWTNLAVDLVRNWWNSNKELVKKYGKIASYRIDMRNDALINKILDKNYTICTSFAGNTDYILDYYHDAVLDNYDFWKKKTYWHSVWIRKHNWVKCVKDNYEGRNYNWLYTNFYEVKPTFKQLVDAGTFRMFWYLYTKVAEDNYEEIIRLEKFKVLANNVLTANSALWNWTNDKILQSKLHTTSEYIRNNNLRYVDNTLPNLR